MPELDTGAGSPPAYANHLRRCSCCEPMDITSTPAPTSLTTRRTGCLFKPGVAKHVSRFPKERRGEALIDWEERELRKKAKKLGIRPDPVKKKRRLHSFQPTRRT
jgi:hypothetical protein